MVGKFVLVFGIHLAMLNYPDLWDEIWERHRWDAMVILAENELPPEALREFEWEVRALDEQDPEALWVVGTYGPVGT